jgi:hypothetical protein
MRFLLRQQAEALINSPDTRKNSESLQSSSTKKKARQRGVARVPEVAHTVAIIHPHLITCSQLLGVPATLSPNTTRVSLLAAR